MSTEIPLDIFEQDLNFWQKLADQSALKRMILSSLNENGAPQIRSMILRSFQLNEKRLIFYTDSRSPKVIQWINEPACQALVYDAAEGLQYRFSGTISIIEEGDFYLHEKAALADYQKKDYQSKMPPSSAFVPAETNPKTELSFAIVKLQVEQLEILAIQPNHKEHIRWSYYYNQAGDLEKSMRLVP